MWFFLCEKYGTVIKKMGFAVAAEFQTHLYLTSDNLLKLTQPHA